MDKKIFTALVKALTDAALYFNTSQQMAMRYNLEQHPSLDFEHGSDYALVGFSGMSSLSIFFVTYMAYSQFNSYVQNNGCFKCIGAITAFFKSILKSGSLGLLFIHDDTVHLYPYILAAISWAPVAASEYTVLIEQIPDCLRLPRYCQKIFSAFYAFASAALYFVSADGFLAHIQLARGSMIRLLMVQFSWQRFTYVALNVLGACAVMPAQYQLATEKYESGILVSSCCQNKMMASVYKGTVPSTSLVALLFTLFFSGDCDSLKIWIVLGVVGLMVALSRIFAELGFYAQHQHNHDQAAVDDYQLIKSTSSLQSDSKKQAIGFFCC